MNENNFLVWHYKTGVPTFFHERLTKFQTALRYINTIGLLKNIFSPYRRLTLKKRTPGISFSEIFDRISFNIISRIIGAIVRLILIVVGLAMAVVILIADLFTVLVWSIVPLFSLNRYLQTQREIFTQEDIQNKVKFLKKLDENPLFQLLTLFFDKHLKEAFEDLPPIPALGIRPNQRVDESIPLLFANAPKLSDYLNEEEIKEEEFMFLVKHASSYLQNTTAPNLIRLGQSLAYGYTNVLDIFSIELTKQPTDAILVRYDLLSQIEKIVARPRDNNVLLVGEPGTGKHRLLKNLAGAINREELTSLKGKRIMLVDTLALIGRGKTHLEIKIYFEALLKEAQRAGNIILVIDDIDRISSIRDDRIDLTDVLTTVLKDQNLAVIGITAPDAFSQYMRPNAALMSIFEKVEVDEMSQEDTLAVLIERSLRIYLQDKVATRFNALLEIVKQTSRLIPDRYQPEKSIRLLEDGLDQAVNQNLHAITTSVVSEVLKQKTKVEVGQIHKNEAEILKNLESLLHKRIIGQDEAITQISGSLRRARTQIDADDKPVGTFLFLGPTGVGKTETAKALAQVYFGSPHNMIRLDMSEFQDDDSIKRLIGNEETRTPGVLVSLVHEHPFGILLLDEFEKANSRVQNLYLQVLDEGFLTDSFGKKVNFNNLMIIATSNAGAEFIRKELTNHEESFADKLVDHILSQGVFSPELINRFDAVIIYHPLSQTEAIQVAKLLLAELDKRLKQSKNITIEISDEIAQKVAEAGFDQTFGARPMRRFIQDKIEDGIATLIIEGKAKNGSVIPTTTLLQFLS